MACKLYIRTETGDHYLGRFRNREKAEEFYRAWLDGLPRIRAGATWTVPIYVETGIGRRRK